MEDKIIELADYFISESKTYREAKIACEKLLKQVSHEIELRALESKTRGTIMEQPHVNVDISGMEKLAEVTQTAAEGIQELIALRKECEFLREMLIDERKFFIETMKYHLFKSIVQQLLAIESIKKSCRKQLSQN